MKKLRCGSIGSKMEGLDLTSLYTTIGRVLDTLAYISYKLNFSI